VPKYLTEFRGDKIYVDSSIFLLVALADPKYGRPSLEFLQRASHGEFELVTSSLTVDEVSFVALKAKLEEKLGVSSSQVLYLKKHPDVVKSLASEVTRVTENVLRLSEIIDVNSADVQQISSLMKTFGLLPRDAIHLAVLHRLGLTDIASGDADFDRLPDVTRYAPSRS